MSESGQRTSAKGAEGARVVPHRIQVSAAIVTAVRERIERRLGVETTVRPEGHVWAVYFDAPAGVNVDFLRPDVLPPAPGTGASRKDNLDG